MTFFVCSQEKEARGALEYALQKGLQTDERKKFRFTFPYSCTSSYYKNHFTLNYLVDFLFVFELEILPNQNTLQQKQNKYYL